MADHTHALRRSADTMLPFLVGLVLGVLSSYASLSGRISTLEADDRTHDKQISALEHLEEQTNDYVRAIAVKVGAHADEELR